MGKTQKEKLFAPLKKFDKFKELVKSYNKNVTPKLKTHTGKDIKGFVFKALEIETIILSFGSKIEDTDRIYFSFLHHEVAEEGLPKNSISMSASPMVLRNNNYVIPFSDETFDPKSITNFDFCEPCPEQCPKFEEKIIDGTSEVTRTYLHNSDFTEKTEVK